MPTKITQDSISANSANFTENKQTKPHRCLRRKRADSERLTGAKGDKEAWELLNLFLILLLVLVSCHNAQKSCTLKTLFIIKWYVFMSWLKI